MRVTEERGLFSPLDGIDTIAGCTGDYKGAWSLAVMIMAVGMGLLALLQRDCRPCASRSRFA